MSTVPIVIESVPILTQKRRKKRRDYREVARGCEFDFQFFLMIMIVKIKATVLPMTKKRACAVLNGHIFVIIRVRYIKVYIFRKRRN